MGRKKQPGTPYIKIEKGFPYYYVTYTKGKRKTLHRLNWEAIYGPIPKGHILRFRDGNTLNCAIDNLELISRAQNCRRNYDAEKVKQTKRSGDFVQSYYASRLYPRDREMRAFVQQHAPDLVEAKRQQLRLRYQLTTYDEKH